MDGSDALRMNVLMVMETVNKIKADVKNIKTEVRSIKLESTGAGDLVTFIITGPQLSSVPPKVN